MFLVYRLGSCEDGAMPSGRQLYLVAAAVSRMLNWGRAAGGPALIPSPL